MGNTWISLRRERAIDFLQRTVVLWGWEQEKSERYGRDTHRERELADRTGIGYFLEILRVTVGMPLSNGRYKAILVNFHNQARLLEVGLGHQPSHKTLTYNLSCLQEMLG